MSTQKYTEIYDLAVSERRSSGTVVFDVFGDPGRVITKALEAYSMPPYMVPIPARSERWTSQSYRWSLPQNVP
jgi:hypothetical protein